MHFVSSSSASNCRMKIADAFEPQPQCGRRAQGPAVTRCHEMLRFQAVVRGNELHGLWRFNAQAL